MFPVQLRGDIVRLRELRREDATASLSVLGDDEVTRWLSFDAQNLDATIEMIEEAVAVARRTPRTEYCLAITLPTGELVGWARLVLEPAETATLGYAVRADRWGRGYATDAARTMIKFGFTDLGLQSISAAVDPDNVASIAVVARLGMHCQDRIHHHIVKHGAWRDSVVYSMLAEEFAAQRRHQ
jgi:ribosomal-protein-alanine N-acetyltransferase